MNGMKRIGLRENERRQVAGVKPHRRAGETRGGTMLSMKLGLLVCCWVLAAAAQTVAWRDAMRQPAAWYGTAEARRIADNLLAYQKDVGGWDKNIDMSVPIAADKRDPAGHATIDNGATYRQMRFLARVYTATHDGRYAASFRKGLQYLLKAQYANGGWPQFYPLRDGYWSHITYNDDAMVGVMELLRDVAARSGDFAFLNDEERAASRRAVDKGIDCMLKTQVVQGGKPTVWCAQHDERTLAPAKARAYELPSLSGSESVGIVEFLMGIEKPSAEVVRAIEAAVEWFRASKITGIRVVRGTDAVVVEDPSAPPLWARFYELGTNRPIFCGRDSVVKYSMAEIEYERRNGYRWYGDRPSGLLETG